MKKLQNNFTTPEQSKQLLKLGVPADSADLHYNSYGGKFVQEHLHITSIRGYSSDAKGFEKLTIPCWSVGRLIEIFDICCIKEETSNAGWCSYRKLYKDQTYIGYVLYVFTINKMQGLLDFSKLEEWV